MTTIFDLLLDPCHDAPEKGILTGRPMNVLSIATLDIVEAMHISHLNKCLATSLDPKSWSIFMLLLCTFLLTSATLVAFFGPHLVSRIVGSREPKVQLGDLDTNYNFLSFLKSIMKRADIDIDSFGDHDKTDKQPDETDEPIPLNPGRVVGGGSTWEPE